MKVIKNFIQRFFPPAMPLKAGNYHFQSPPNAVQPLRLHLRIEPGGTGILIINASTVLHLNQTAAEYVFHLVQQTPETEVGKIFADRYNISNEQANQDFMELREKINSLVYTPDLDPVTFLDMERISIYSGSLSAPYRLDCALTYHQMGRTPGEVAPFERVKQELNTEQWSTILLKASQAGIPHVIFTGGEPTLRADLVELIEMAEKLGMVAGLLTNGLRLSEPEYLQSLLKSGLDHVMILLDPASVLCWKAIQQTAEQDLALTVHVTLTPENIHSCSQMISDLKRYGVNKISISALQPELKDYLVLAQKLASEARLGLVWDLPVPYSVFNPVSAELEGHEEIPQGAGKAWLYIEPDGDVLPGQGVALVMGNLLMDSWEIVWGNRLQ